MFAKTNFFTINIKRNLSAIIFLALVFSLIIFSESNLNASKLGLNLWANSVVPSLLPFFIATELLLSTNIVNICGKVFKKIMKPLFNVPGEAFIALLLGILSGYPVGAKIVCELKEKKICNKIECERLLAFTNNSGPLFIVGTVGTSLFCNNKIGITLLIIHILSAISVGIIFRFWKKNEHQNYFEYNKYDCSNKQISIKNLGEILSNAISKSISTIFMIGGFIITFSVFISIIYQTQFLNLLNFMPYNISEIVQSLFIGFIELTNGMYEISRLRNKYFYFVYY